jgi:predicted membrane protein
MRGEHRRTASGHLFMGGMLILVGLLFLLDTLGVANTGGILARGWPVILIAIGVQRFFSCNTPEARIAGGAWIFLGSVFLLSRLGFLQVNVWRLLWPLALIVIGASLVMRSRNARKESSSDDSNISAMAFLGGVERKIRSQAFQGGELTAVMGGCNIDLRQAAIEGSEAELSVFVMMGGIELYVPPTWTVVSRVVPVLGSFEDHTNGSTDATKRLLIRGTVMMGGIDVKTL